ERFWTPDATRSFTAFVDDLSNWYIRRSRRRFWDEDAEALQALWNALSRSVQVIAPVMPFLADHLWRTLRGDEQPDSVFLEPWPEHGAFDDQLLEEVAEVRSIVELGRQARGEAGLKLRQPLRRMVVQGAEKAKGHAEEIGEELRIKEVEFGPVEATELDDELRQEGRVYDLTHQLNTMRKEAGLALMDRIRVVLPDSDADLLAYEDRIKDEVLATEIVVERVAEPQVQKV